MVNNKTQAAIDAMGMLGIKYVKRTPAHIYFDIPSAWDKVKIDKLAKEFIRQTGVGCKFRRV